MGNKPARTAVEALIVEHVENLSDEKTIRAIQKNPYMQYLLGLGKFTEKPVFMHELFVLVRKRLDHDFFNMLTLMLSEADSSRLIDRLLDKFYTRHTFKKPQIHRPEARRAFIALVKRKRKGKKFIDKTKLAQIRCQ